MYKVTLERGFADHKEDLIAVYSEDGKLLRSRWVDPTKSYDYFIFVSDLVIYL